MHMALLDKLQLVRENAILLTAFIDYFTVLLEYIDTLLSTVHKALKDCTLRNGSYSRFVSHNHAN